MEALFESGVVVVIILILVAIEAIVLLVFQKKTGRGIAAVPMLANLVAGGCLMLAIRSALLDHPWTWTGAFMAMALLAHLIDFGSRIGRDTG
ncbi:MAG: hypothetical protein AAGA21_01850 [Pseudomonadota bacterium]